jgi:hypothetical protein
VATRPEDAQCRPRCQNEYDPRCPVRARHCLFTTTHRCERGGALIEQNAEIKRTVAGWSPLQRLLKEDALHWRLRHYRIGGPPQLFLLGLWDLPPAQVSRPPSKRSRCRTVILASVPVQCSRPLMLAYLLSPLCTLPTSCTLQ